MFVPKRLGTVAAVAALAAAGTIAMPHDAKAWWRGGYGFGFWAPPIVAVPPPVYVPPPVVYTPPPVAYYPPPTRVWIPPHWEGPYWVRGHWS